MYFTGLRVSNLLLLTVRNIKELMYDSLGTELQIIKGGRSNQLISLGDDAQRILIADFYDDIATLLKDKNDDDPVFTSEKNNKISLHRVTFTQSLNNTLKYASEEFHKKITCHSFRPTFITEGIRNEIPIHIIHKAVGHRNIQSTEHYVRHDLSPKEWIHVVKTTNRHRVNSFAIKIPENIIRKNKKNQNKDPLLFEDQTEIYDNNIEQ